MGIPPVSPPFYTHPARTMPRQTLLGALIVSLLAVSAQDADQDVNTDCTCACAASSSAAKTEYHIAVGSEAACTPAKCIDERAECTAGGLVEATYHDCTCHCCNVGQCQNGMQPYPFKVDFPEQCTAAKCASEFYQCPNDPNNAVANPTTASLTFATYQDCTCACKATSTAALVYKMFYAGSPETCTPDQCSSKYYACPDPGMLTEAVGGVVEATYAGVVPSPSPPPNAADVPPPPPSPPPPPTSPKSLVLADYESSAGRVSVLTAFVTIFMFL
jgi:hypothetical protein